MSLTSLIKSINSSALTKEILSRINKENEFIIEGGPRIARAIISTTLAQTSNKPLLVIVPTMEESTRWHSLLLEMSWKRVYIYPTSEISPYEKIQSATEIVWGQFQVLSELTSQSNPNNLAVITTERALQPHLPTSKLFKQNCIYIEKGTSIELDELSLKLSRLGYERMNSIEQEATWARRGDILEFTCR